MSSLSKNESRAEKDRQKQIQDKCQALLTQMLRDEDNKYCVDCDAKGPRWASWNLGIFLCIRCAGIHRNLGVHISKVKSVNLDSWTPEQVVSLQQMGNSRARAVYEATLPDSWRRPQTDSSLESFIRAKYQHKKYIAKEWIPPPLPKVDWDKEFDEEAERQKKRKKEKTAPAVVKKPIAETPVPALPKPNASPKASRTKADNSSKNATVDLLGFNSPTSTGSPLANAINSSSDDVFSNFLSIPGNSSCPLHSLNQSSFKPEDGSAIKSSDDVFANFSSVPGNSSCPLHGLNQSSFKPEDGGANNSSDDVFSNLSAPANSSCPHGLNQSPFRPADNSNVKGRSAEEENFFNQPVPNKEKKQLSKDSILALYGSGNQQSTMYQNPGLFQQPMNTFHQSNVYPNGVNQMYQTSVPPLGSNPFFNMCSGQLPNQFPLQSLPHASNTVSSQPQTQNGDLLVDFSSETSTSQLPQQMANLSISNTTQPPTTQYPPMSNFSGSNFLTQAPNANPQIGQTFTMHLWQ